MKLMRCEPEHWSPNYEILLQGLDLKNATSIPTPFSSSWGIVPPGSVTTTHRHDEHEMFLVIEGEITALVNGEEIGLVPGDVLISEPFEAHQLQNRGERPARFVDIVWRSPGSVTTIDSNVESPVFVLSMPPTPNGDLHLGHISGPYLGADAYVRYLRMTGVTAFHISGTDDNQSYVEGKARELGVSPREVVDRYGEEIATTLAALDLTPDWITRPMSCSGYEEFIREFFKRLVQQGILRFHESLAAAGRQTGSYLYEYRIRGRCPSCDAMTGGNICEECAIPNGCIDLIDAASLTGEAVESRSISRWHLHLLDHQSLLRDHHAKSAMNARVRTLLERTLERMKTIPVSHPVDHGIATGLEETPNQCIWPWVEMVGAHCYGITEVCRSHGIDADRAVKNGRLAIFFGIDNAAYVTVLHPPLYAAFLGIDQPRIDYVCNEFYMLEHQKFSTSRGHAVWGRELLSTVLSDEIRFYLAWTRPESQRTNFDRINFECFLREKLGEWNELLTRVQSSVVSFGESVDTGLWTIEQHAFAAQLARYPDQLRSYLETSSFSLQRAARQLQALVELTVQFASGETYWQAVESRKSEYKTSVALQLASLRLLALIASPLMPRFSQYLWSALGLSGSVGQQRWPDSVEFVPAGKQIHLKPYFGTAVDSMRTCSSGIGSGRSFSGAQRA